MKHIFAVASYWDTAIILHVGGHTKPALLVGVHVCSTRLHPLCMPLLCCCLQTVQSCKVMAARELQSPHKALAIATLSIELLRTMQL